MINGAMKLLGNTGYLLKYTRSSSIEKPAFPFHVVIVNCLGTLPCMSFDELKPSFNKLNVLFTAFPDLSVKDSHVPL
ncbi:hypothetical protein AGMMS49941_08150 [Deferribacterales bacterium]|nr:hypothetical protein AGMMS49941_08150 [Deferribacterales bacterium]